MSPTATAPDVRYPVGEFKRPTATLSSSERATMIDQIEQTPANFRAAVKGLNDKQLAMPYRPEGWMVRQVVHHVADSHMNAYCRFKLALTEDVPTIKAYDESKWAELVDGKSALVAESLTLLDVLHTRWVMLLRSMKPADFNRMLNHPEWKAPGSLDVLLALYAWHGRHHCAHITELRKRESW